MKTNDVFLRQIIDFVDDIENYIGNINFDDFEKSGLLQDAVLRKIELIGESAKRLSVDFWEKYKEMIHQYDDVDLKIVWNTIKNDLPELKKKIGQVL